HGDASGGTVTITTNGNVTGTNFGGASIGIWGSNTTGDVVIHSNGNTSATGTAIFATTTTGNISIFGNGTIAGDSDFFGGGVGDGIDAETVSGAINITTSTGSIILPGVSGIVANATGPTSNDIIITSGGTIGLVNAAMGGAGIAAQIGNAASTG